MRRDNDIPWAEPLSQRDLADGLARLLEGRPEADCVWLFGYGALLWQSHDAFAAVERVRIDGWRRRFCLWSAVSRGTRERPGLGLGLVPGDAVEGLALQVPGAGFDGILARIWRQEMYAGLYEPTWLTADGIDGGRRHVLAFVTRPAHPQFAGNLSLTDQAAIIRGAVGENGSCRDYLAQTVAALGNWKLRDDELAELLSLVDGVTVSGHSPP